MDSLALQILDIKASMSSVVIPSSSARNQSPKPSAFPIRLQPSTTPNIQTHLICLQIPTTTTSSPRWRHPWCPETWMWWCCVPPGTTFCLRRRSVVSAFVYTFHSSCSLQANNRPLVKIWFYRSPKTPLPFRFVSLQRFKSHSYVFKYVFHCYAKASSCILLLHTIPLLTSWRHSGKNHSQSSRYVCLGLPSSLITPFISNPYQPYLPPPPEACPNNTFARSGATSCTPCPRGASTAQPASAECQYQLRRYTRYDVRMV